MPAGRPRNIKLNKKCKLCQIVKSNDEFHHYRAICKTCRKQKDHDYYVNHRK